MNHVEFIERMAATTEDALPEELDLILAIAEVATEQTRRRKDTLPAPAPFIPIRLVRKDSPDV